MSQQIGRPQAVPIGRDLVQIPTFFASVSSVKTNLLPTEYVELLRAVHVPQILVSAYDIAKAGEYQGDLLALLRGSVESGQTVLVDSGNYESYWHNDESWTVAQFHEVLGRLSASAFLSFDQRGNSRDVANAIVEGLTFDREIASGPVWPIVHGEFSTLPDLCAEVAARANPVFIAVAERELGDGILQRIRTTQLIRQRLIQSVGSYIPLHVLGTGNPRSIMLLAIAGADTFDGLEWCQTVVSEKDAMLHHFQHSELVADLDRSLPLAERTLLHNLGFYSRWLARVRRVTESGAWQELVQELFERDVAKNLIRLLSANG